MPKKGNKVGTYVGSGNAENPHYNPNLVRLSLIKRNVFDNLAKQMKPDESWNDFFSRISQEGLVVTKSRSAPKTICGIKLRKRHN